MQIAVHQDDAGPYVTLATRRRYRTFWRSLTLLRPLLRLYLWRCRRFHGDARRRLPWPRAGRLLTYEVACRRCSAITLERENNSAFVRRLRHPNIKETP